MAFEQRKVLPTKINLIRLRRELQMLRKIRKVLEEKRDVLLLYIRQTADEYKQSYRKAAESLEHIYSKYFASLTTIGTENIRNVVAGIPDNLRVDIGTRILFAVKTPTIAVQPDTIPEPPTAVTRFPPSMLEIRKDLVEALKALIKVVETEAALRRLLQELRETQRLINALDYSIMPRYESAIKFIKLVLDDRLREDVMRLKMLKRRLEIRRRRERGA